MVKKLLRKQKNDFYNKTRIYQSFKTTVIFIAIIVFSLSCASKPAQTVQPDELDIAIRDASDYLNDNIPKGSMIVILNIQSDSSALSDYIIDELIANAVNDKIFKVVDRQQLDLIRTEQNFQLSGEVDDNLALSIGRFFGAQTIVSGRVSQMGERYRMTIRALEVQTAQVQGQYNRNIIAGPTITALMRNSGSSTLTQTTSTRTTGTASRTVSATAGGTASTRAAVPAITGISINPENTSVDKGMTQQFEATVSGINNPDLSVTWTVSGNMSSGTTISEDGVLTIAEDEIVTPLTVTVTATADRSKSASATVEVVGGITAMSVTNNATWNNAINQIRSGGNDQTYIINVIGNVTVAPNNENIFGSITGLTVTILGSGTLSLSGAGGNILQIGERQTVIVRDVTMRGRSNNNNAVVVIGRGGIFRLEGIASITGNTTNRNGAGGVYINEGTFILDGGSIISNAATARNGGGGVYVDGGIFIIESGEVTNNNTQTTWSGGGVTVYNRGVFTMKSGTISGNTSTGAGVTIERGTFNMEGGTIKTNTGNNGGGVFIRNGTFTKIGGTIYGNDESQSLKNTASRRGHAVHWENGPRWRNATAGPDDNTDSYGFWMND